MKIRKNCNVAVWQEEKPVTREYDNAVVMQCSVVANRCMRSEVKICDGGAHYEV